MCPEEAPRGDDALRGIRRRLDEVIKALPQERGVYALCFRLDREVNITSRSGKVIASVGPGLVLYVGSAGGPGGLRARLSRHLMGASRCWWHVDCVSGAASSVKFVFYVTGSSGVESEDSLARRLAGLSSLRPIGRVGATDASEPHMFICYDEDSVIAALMPLGKLIRLRGRSAEA